LEQVIAKRSFDDERRFSHSDGAPRVAFDPERSARSARERFVRGASGPSKRGFVFESYPNGSPCNQGANMSHPVKSDTIEPARSALRVLVGRVELALSKLGNGEHSDASKVAQLSSAWAEVVHALGLGAEPALRQCPSCKRSILQEAVRCRYCMQRSPSTVSQG
jgi:hypothetical protein